MADQDANSFYALLIGIDLYLPNLLPNGGYYRSLTGCVRDVLRVEEFLLVTQKIPSSHICKLTSSNNHRELPPEPREHWPTYENIVSAFCKLTSIAQPGDQVYIHYSGHGGRALTPEPFRALKGQSGVDEVLVPMDIGNSEAGYLRDYEVAYLLKKMVDKGLIVTVVMDCCHAGSATTGWLLEPQGYVLLAACGAHEAAYEFPFDGEEKHGALSYWLVDSLKHLKPGITYKALYQRILAKVRGHSIRQTPLLHGEGDRVVFGREQIKTQSAIGVMSVDTNNQYVTLMAGQAQGIFQGAQLVIHSPDATDLAQNDKQLALAEIMEIGATESLAKITHLFGHEPIEQGAQAVLLNVGTRLRRMVRVGHQDNLSSNSSHETALRAIEQALIQRGGGFLQLASNKEAADYEVRIDDNNEYIIFDVTGAEVLNIGPALRIFNDDAPALLVERLIHLARYQNIYELDNHDPFSPLRHKLIVELAGVQADYVLGERPQPRPFSDTDRMYTVKDGEWAFLRICNDHSNVLNITVLGLQPDRAITQIYPSGAGYFESLDPGRELVLPVHATLPIGMEVSTNIIKVFATLGVPSFRWLELPSLDRLAQEKLSVGGIAADSPEESAAIPALEECGTRDMSVSSVASWEWVASQVELQIQRF
jgi:hypothetical protein